MKKILLPIDLAQTEKAEALVAAAKQIGNAADSSFTLVYVVSSMPGYMMAELPEDFGDKAIENARGELEKFAIEHGLGGNSEIVVRSGSPQRQIVSVAEEKGIDLIVIASHKPEAVDYLLGSVAAAVVRHAPCSVLVQR